MITNPIDYYNAIQQIKDKNKPQYAILLPTDENIYNIDLSTREVEAPEYLSLYTDQYAETVYFKADRYYDNMDLADTVCTIQYVNDGVKKLTGEEDEGRVYLVPFIDIFTFKKENKILIPWQISGEVARVPGNITFSIRFFKLNEIGQYIYNINTLPAKSKILNGLDLNLEEYDDIYKDSDIITSLENRINDLSNLMGLYWIEA